MASSGFAPVAAPDARVLILGTLPGALSLARGQYYAQPRNAFWRIMGELVGASPEHSYEQRLRRLLRARIALWDVCASAHRPGSLDSSIRASSVVANDFAAFLAMHRRIGVICFNGATAARLFERHAVARLDPSARVIERRVLPSTSPAHAGMSFELKLAAWRAGVRATR